MRLRDAVVFWLRALLMGDGRLRLPSIPDPGQEHHPPVVGGERVPPTTLRFAIVWLRAFVYASLFWFSSRARA